MVNYTFFYHHFPFPSPLRSGCPRAARWATWRKNLLHFLIVFHLQTTKKFSSVAVLNTFPARWVSIQEGEGRLKTLLYHFMRNFQDLRNYSFSSWFSCNFVYFCSTYRQASIMCPFLFDLSAVYRMSAVHYFSNSPTHIESCAFCGFYYFCPTPN